MKLLFVTIIFGLLTSHALSQEVDRKNILLISPGYYGENCEQVAFRVSADKIEIDNCYDLNSGKFNSREFIGLKEEPVVKTIFEKSTEELKSYEKEINDTNCDYLDPIFIYVFDEGKETKIEWKRIQNCYPKTMKAIIEELESVFEKYK